jgi:hypothetical protein
MRKREEASIWVNGYTATAIGLVFAGAGLSKVIAKNYPAWF